MEIEKLQRENLQAMYPEFYQQQQNEVQEGGEYVEGEDQEDIEENEHEQAIEK